MWLGIEEAKKALRISSEDFNEEIVTLLEASERDLMTAGVIDSAFGGADPELLKMAQIMYCKANFGFNEQGEKYNKAYENMKSLAVLASGCADKEAYELTKKFHSKTGRRWP